MKPIKFNSTGKSNFYQSHFERLDGDYELYRKKHFSQQCISILKKTYPSSKLLLTHSATGALEIIAHILNINVGDEIIMPSFTFVSTANTFARMGAKPVFVDIDSKNLTIDPKLIEKNITHKTKAIVAMHYIGHPCDLDQIKRICKQHKLLLIEDAATGFGADYKGKPLGSIGDFGVISFDITKHISAIQGGLLIINHKESAKRAQQIYHNGTNRNDFEGGSVPYYHWVDFGSKYQMNELNAAFLFDQLFVFKDKIAHRKNLSSWYHNALQSIQLKSTFTTMPDKHVKNNMHAYYIILKDPQQRNDLQQFLAKNNVEAFFHYTPLHKSPMGIKLSKNTPCLVTDKVASTLLRLPFHDELNHEDVLRVVKLIKSFFNEEK